MHRSLLHMPRVDLPSLPKLKNSFRSAKKSLATQLAKATNFEPIPPIQTQKAFNQIPSDPFHPFHGFGTLIISHCRMVLATRKTRNKRTIRIKSARRIARKEFIPLVTVETPHGGDGPRAWRCYLETVKGHGDLKKYMVIYLQRYMICFKNKYGPPRSPKNSGIPPLAFGWYHGRSLEFQSGNLCTQPWVRQGIGVCSGVVKSLLLTGYPLWCIFFQMNSDKKRKATHALPGDDP